MTMTTAEKIAAIEAAPGLLLAWDGCHKTYLLDTPEKVADAADTGYGVYPASQIREIISDSCGLVFVSNWGLIGGTWDHDWAIDQCTEDIYEAAESMVDA